MLHVAEKNRPSAYKIREKIQSITLIADSVIPEFAHIPDREFQSRAETPQSIFLYSLVFGYTGFLIYRTQNLSPNPQSGIRAIDCSLLDTKKSSMQKSILSNFTCLTGYLATERAQSGSFHDLTHLLVVRVLRADVARSNLKTTKFFQANFLNLNTSRHNTKESKMKYSTKSSST